MEFKITFLGTADAVPSKTRNHSAFLLSYATENILIDCGEGTQRQFKYAKISPSKVTRIFITHWHGDHVLGIPGLLQTLAFTDYKKTLFIYGPKGTKKYMKELLKTFIFVNKIKIKVQEIDKGKLDLGDLVVSVAKMTHGAPCNAYCFKEKSKLRIDKKKLQKLKIPTGKHLSKLKQGKNITYKGKKYLAKNLTYDSGGKKICFIMDTNYNKNIVPFAKDSNLLVMESSFSDEIKGKARQYKHMTAKQDAEIAKKAKVKKLILTHLSQRYDKNPKKILKEAKKNFKNTVLAKDLQVVEV